MVFRGIPSKACERCRKRRLRCDLQRPHCSSCVRVGIACSGYRDTSELRFTDESELVRNRFLAKANNEAITRQNLGTDGIPKIKVQHLPQDIQVISRDMFFRYYVSDFGRSWGFLNDYLDSPDAPAHITLGIEAVSLAFLSHQVSSQTARNLGRRKYCEALRSINALLQTPGAAQAKSTFEGALLLDLFEKLSKSASAVGDDKHTHVAGAFALVKLRGVESFTAQEIAAVTGLSLNGTLTALSTGRATDTIIRQIRHHATQFLDTSDPKWKLTGLILEATDLAASVRHGTITSTEKISRNIHLDTKLAAIAESASPFWTYTSHPFPNADPKGALPAGLPPTYTIYPSRTIAQMWNVLRLTRILLCEEILASLALTPSSPSTLLTASKASTTIHQMTSEICASLPHMTHCSYAARHKLLGGENPDKQHTHTVPHTLDVYVMIFAIYVVAWAPHAPLQSRDWGVTQLENMATHFGSQEASVILEVLRRQREGKMESTRTESATETTTRSAAEVRYPDSTALTLGLPIDWYMGPGDSASRGG